jgi:thiol:disulfide interchange protein DsbD
MEKLKQFLGFPMLLSVIWLLWVAGLQMSYDSVVMLLVSLCFLALFFWFLRTIRHGTLRLIALLVSLALVVYPLYWIQQELTQKHHINEPNDYSSEKLENLIKDHHKVFVYATAAWCITCKINEKIAIDTNEVQNFFNKEHIIVIKADWTNKNDAILQYLQHFNRAGVPLYVYYPQSGDPVVLPQILTPLTIIDHIKKCP